MYESGRIVKGADKVVSQKVEKLTLGPGGGGGVAIVNSCVTNGRRVYLKGKDVTADANGNPVPMGTRFRKDTTLVFDPAKGWLVEDLRPAIRGC